MNPLQIRIRHDKVQAEGIVFKAGLHICTCYFMEKSPVKAVGTQQNCGQKNTQKKDADRKKDARYRKRMGNQREIWLSAGSIGVLI